MPTQVVWKFPIEVDDDFSVQMPQGAEILYVDVQYGRPVMWAKVDPDAEVVWQHFHVRGTGHSATGVGDYIGSFQLLNGDFVGHLFRAEQ